MSLMTLCWMPSVGSSRISSRGRRECAGDGELLALATGEIAAAAAQKLAEDGKEVEDLRRHPAAARSGGKGRFQVFLHGEADAVVDAHRLGAGGVNELAGGGVLAIGQEDGGVALAELPFGQGTKQGQGQGAGRRWRRGVPPPPPGRRCRR
jgi:hypothetical protein